MSEQLPLARKWGALEVEYNCTERRDVVFISRRKGGSILVTLSRELGIQSKRWSPVYINWCGMGNVDRQTAGLMKKALEIAELLAFEMETGRVHQKFYKGD